MGVVVDDEHALAESMKGGDINMTPKVRAHVEKETGWFFTKATVLRGATVVLWSKHESQETLFIELGSTRLVGTPWVCWACRLCMLRLATRGIAE
jgi:hypothetical protein